MRRLATFWCITIVAAFPLHLAAAGAVSQDVPVPGGTLAMARSLGIDPAPERARFVSEAVRLVHPSSESTNTTRAKAAATLHRAQNAARPDDSASAALPAETVPIPLTVAVWSRAVFRRAIAPESIVTAILADSRAAHLCYGLAGVDDETLQYLIDHPAVITRLYEHDAAVFAAFGGSLRIQRGQVVSPGGAAGAAVWEALVGAGPENPERFIRELFGQEEGRLAYLYDSIAQIDAPRAAFALGLWMKDAGARVKRFKLLAEVNRVGFPQWQPAKLPFTRPLYDVATLLARVEVEPDGSPSFPALRSWWSWVFEAEDIPATPPRVDSSVDDGPVDAAWLAGTLVSGDTRARAERLDQFAFGQRVFGGADAGAAADILTAIRAFPRYRMLGMTLERMGSHRAAVYALAARRAQQLSTIESRRAFVALGEFQGALALIARMLNQGTLDLAAAEALATSLATVSVNQDGSYNGGIATWLQDELRPAVPADATMEEALFQALAGARRRSRPPARFVDWEGQRYRLDPAAAEEQRLRRVRAKQESLTVDVALTLRETSRRLSAASLPMADVAGAAETLKNLAAEFGARHRNPDPPAGGLRRAREVVDRAVEDLAKINAPGDVHKAARIGTSLAAIVDETLADALIAWTYAISIADADSAILLTGNVTHRHDFGLGPVERSVRSRLAWAVPKQEILTRTPWHVSGSLLGLDVALASLALRRVNGERVVDPPTLSANERDTFAVSVALLDPSALRDEDRDAIAAAIARGHLRVASLAEDSGGSERIVEEIQMDGWRRRALHWTIANEPQRIGSMFSLAELLVLGGAPIASLHSWGMSGLGWSGCFCSSLSTGRTWRLLIGRPQLGLMATAVPDLHLHVAMMLRELALPAAIAKIVLAAAVQDFIDEVRPTDFNDWLTLVRTARTVSRERIEDYVAAATAAGPLIAEPAASAGQP